MARYEIKGGAPLHGSVTISGAKNAAVAILPAALLVNGEALASSSNCLKILWVFSPVQNMI